MGEKHIKIAILSYNIHSSHMNYGAALHSWAFQQYLNNNTESVIINYYPKSLSKYNLKYPILRSINIRHPRSSVKNIVNWSLGFVSNIRKYNKFQHFFTINYKATEKQYSYNELLSINQIENFAFDVFVCESDVIWKLYKENDFDEVFFLNIPAAKGHKKVAYAPSIASRPFTLSEQEKIKYFTKDYYAISSREESGAKYLTQILNRSVKWVLDPVLLLNAEDYYPISIKPKEQHYLLLYNCIMNDREMLREAKKLSNRLGLKLIEISCFSINKLRFSHRVKDDIGIEEFLGYFQNADFVVCNSFHGCCFSILFKKQFFLFERDRKDFRMEDLTRGLQCQERMIPCDNKHIPEDFSPIDYTHVYDNLNKLRIASYDFIQKNIIE